MVKSLEDLEKYWFNPQKDPFDGKKQIRISFLNCRESVMVFLQEAVSLWQQMTKQKRYKKAKRYMEKFPQPAKARRLK